MRVTANDGFNTASATSRVFRSLGAPPVVRIFEPRARALRAQDATLFL